MTTVGTQRSTRHGVHVRFRNVFVGSGGVVVPQQYLLVVGRAHETIATVVKGDGIHTVQMVIVFLDHFTTSQIVLHDGTVFAGGHHDEGFRGRIQDLVDQTPVRKRSSARPTF